MTMEIKLTNGKTIPIEMHKVRIVQKTQLPPIDQRLRAIEEAGYNTFLLRTRDVFIDMLTDSGTNAMSDNQLAAMMVSDDAYAGGESYYKLLGAVKDVLGFEYCVPAHQGRAAEHMLDEDLRQAGRCRADELPLHHDQGPLRAGRRQGAGDLHRRGHEDRQRSSLQGQPRPGQVRRRSSRSTARRRSPSSAWRPPRT